MRHALGQTTRASPQAPLTLRKVMLARVEQPHPDLIGERSSPSVVVRTTPTHRSLDDLYYSRAQWLIG